MNNYYRFKIALFLQIVILCSCGKNNNPKQLEFVEKQELAKQGDLLSQYWLSVQYADGNEFVKPDPKLAYYWSKLAAEKGHPDAQYFVALNNEKGLGIDIDIDAAIDWYKKCSVNGDGKWQSEAQLKLATMTWGGIKTGIDSIAAYDLVAKSALQKNPAACCILGIMNLRKGLPPENEVIAKTLFEVGAERGFSRSQFFLAGIYWKGSYVEHDFQKAADLMMKSAEQGYSDAQYILAIFYNEGIGVPKNTSKAIEWCEKAVKSGNKDAVEYFKKLK